MCPRHFCNGCNKTDNIAFMCAFCTIASCKDCPSIIQNHFGWNDYVVLPKHMLHPNDCLEKYANITWIACHLCTKHLKERKKKHPMELDPLDMSNVQQFCGVCNEQNIVVTTPLTLSLSHTLNKNIYLYSIIKHDCTVQTK